MAQRFADMRRALAPLDLTMDYIFTLRLEPKSVRLRLIAGPALNRSYICVHYAA